METKFHRALAFPFFLLAMAMLSGIFTLGIQFKENNLSQYLDDDDKVIEISNSTVLIKLCPKFTV